MERGIIKVENDDIILPDAPVWMTIEEISDLFMVSPYEIRKSLRTLFRNGIITETNSVRLHHYAKGCYAEVYDMETVVALSFCINVRTCLLFRKLILQKRISFFYICMHVTDYKHKTEPMAEHTYFGTT